MQLIQFRKKISWFAIILLLQRFPTIPWIKGAIFTFSSLAEKIWTWKVVLPSIAATGSWHSLSGASSYVDSSQANPAYGEEGDSFQFIFFTRGYRADSYQVSGLPSGLTYNGSSSVPTISGTLPDAGTYNISIKGYRFSNFAGASTSTYNLTINVDEPSTPITDSDNDGIADEIDTDDDNDGVLDSSDAFPLDDSEHLDTDGDGTGNNSDTDDDGDGVPDSSDAFPLQASEYLDTDVDGLGNNSDLDDDGDGVLDSSDAFPLDDSEHLDTDGDGTGNNADTDDDGDGVLDSSDAFSLDAADPLNIWNDSNTTDLGSGWYKSDWFGYFFSNTSGWCFHSIHGWIYIIEDSESGIWFYESTLGWLYTTKSLYPFIYQNSSGNWLYDLSTFEKRKFWSYEDSSTISL